MCNLGDPGKSQGSSYCSLVKCVTLFEEQFVLLPILLEELRCIPETLFCELYVVKFWEGMV